MIGRLCGMRAEGVFIRGSCFPSTLHVIQFYLRRVSLHQKLHSWECHALASVATSVLLLWAHNARFP
ncbi:hypothetical protein Mal15_13110 [Stieleria maiorica]|uniref:Uncharacterized protein n=1 Tax=Stieleria maiorica TaxID=2795974 RepID=A0A5B9M809_9BACT|nr:hypothetical protein Mal15_13110 [Stieleria maiorica]